MLARVSTYEIPLERLDAAVEAFGHAIGQIREAAGLHAAYVLVNDVTGRTLTMTFWDNRASMEASRVSASILRSDATRSLEGVTLSTEEFEVAAHEIGHAP